MVNWKSLDAKDRLLAALVAAHPDKKLLDYRRIATYYGEGTTYDSIEGQFRIIRKEAQKLRDAVDSGEHAQAPPRGGATPKSKDNISSTNNNNAATSKTSTPKARNSSAKKPKPKTIDLTGGVISGRITKSKSPPTQRKNAPLAQAAGNHIMGLSEDIISSGSSMVAIDDDGLDFADLDAFADGDWSAPFAM